VNEFRGERQFTGVAGSRRLGRMLWQLKRTTNVITRMFGEKSFDSKGALIFNTKSGVKIGRVNNIFSVHVGFWNPM